MAAENDNIALLSALTLLDVGRVGGKNASLGELIGALSFAGVRVPGGFATTTDAYRRFLKANRLDEKIRAAVDGLDNDDTVQLAATAGAIRQWIVAATLPPDLEHAICENYRKMGDEKTVAVRSSATAEDLPDASFAGQQESFLNIRGEAAVLEAVKLVFASLFTDRAVSYRRHRGYGDCDVALSVAVQEMVRSDLAASGVMFSLDTESGFEQVVFITAAYGLGETIVQGAVNPDEFYVYKPALAAGRQAIIRRRLGDKLDKMVFAETATRAGASLKTVPVDDKQRRQFCIGDDDIRTLAKYAVAIEKHYRRRMDIEWAKDGVGGELYIVQARPETVQSRRPPVADIVRYHIEEKGAVLASGRAIGQKIGVGKTRVIGGPDEMARVMPGDVLVTQMTDPDWEPVMKRAAAIVTRRGGRTCHAAIIARELGVPAIVGCGDSADNIGDGQEVTVCCAEGDSGHVYAGAMKFSVARVSPTNLPPLPVKLQINIANPDLAFEFAKLPSAGVGLARLEFIIARSIGFHPRCALDFDKLPDELQRQVTALSAGYESATECYVGKIRDGVATIAAAFHPRTVIVRLSDFKSNEYAGLVGGRRFEPLEENPMLGFRGASRYAAATFADCFALECAALKQMRAHGGLDNVWIMIPFVRTVVEAETVIAELKKNGISRDEWKIIMMCEVPANALLAEEFLQHFDGFSIGSNDLTQLTLALDRDSELVAATFDERDAAVRQLISRAIAACKKQQKYVGICGQAPSDYPEYAAWLMARGISAISLNPDALVETHLRLATAMNADNGDK